MDLNLNLILKYSLVEKILYVKTYCGICGFNFHNNLVVWMYLCVLAK